VFVPPNFSFKPVHHRTQQLTVYSRQPEKQTTVRILWSAAALLPLFSLARTIPYLVSLNQCLEWRVVIVRNGARRYPGFVEALG
jgi:hypothetical protein